MVDGRVYEESGLFWEIYLVVWGIYGSLLLLCWRKEERRKKDKFDLKVEMFKNNYLYGD